MTLGIINYVSHLSFETHPEIFQLKFGENVRAIERAFITKD
jgi:hypothetical protein